MRNLRVELGDRSYPIFIGEKNWSQIDWCQYCAGSRALIVTNDCVAPLYLKEIKAALTDQLQVDQLILADGEIHKNQQTLGDIYDHLLQQRHDRTTTIIALGGGVIGDMAGYAAATYQRGVPFIQVPTTLLAQVDSSVGGKTAINHPRGKNMIGAFYQPQAVVIDITTLHTLPDREFSAGMAEVIKYGLIRDIDFLAWLEGNLDRLMGKDPDALAQAIETSCRIKAEVVSADEREQGLRAILNLGHTFGHAIEAAQGYADWLHGEAVGAGMAMAARMSEAMGMISSADVERVEKILQGAKLPIRAPQEINADVMRDLMGHDKKVQKGKLRLVLLDSLGHACIESDYDEGLLNSVLVQR